MISTTQNSQPQLRQYQITDYSATPNRSTVLQYPQPINFSSSSNNNSSNVISSSVPYQQQQQQFQNQLSNYPRGRNGSMQPSKNQLVLNFPSNTSTTSAAMSHVNIDKSSSSASQFLGINSAFLSQTVPNEPAHYPRNKITNNNILSSEQNPKGFKEQQQIWNGTQQYQQPSAGSLINSQAQQQSFSKDPRSNLSNNNNSNTKPISLVNRPIISPARQRADKQLVQNTLQDVGIKQLQQSSDMPIQLQARKQSQISTTIAAPQNDPHIQYFKVNQSSTVVPHQDQQRYLFPQQYPSTMVSPPKRDISARPVNDNNFEINDRQPILIGQQLTNKNELPGNNINNNDNITIAAVINTLPSQSNRSSHDEQFSPSRSDRRINKMDYNQPQRQQSPWRQVTFKQQQQQQQQPIVQLSPQQQQQQQLFSDSKHEQLQQISMQQIAPFGSNTLGLNSNNNNNTRAISLMIGNNNTNIHNPNSSFTAELNNNNNYLKIINNSNNIIPITNGSSQLSQSSSALTQATAGLAKEMDSIEEEQHSYLGQRAKNNTINNDSLEINQTIIMKTPEYSKQVIAQDNYSVGSNQIQIQPGNTTYNHNNNVSFTLRTSALNDTSTGIIQPPLSQRYQQQQSQILKEFGLNLLFPVTHLNNQQVRVLDIALNQVLQASNSQHAQLSGSSSQSPVTTLPTSNNNIQEDYKNTTNGLITASLNNTVSLDSTPVYSSATLVQSQSNNQQIIQLKIPEQQLSQQILQQQQPQKQQQSIQQQPSALISPTPTSSSQQAKQAPVIPSNNNNNNNSSFIVSQPPSASLPSSSLFARPTGISQLNTPQTRSQQPQQQQQPGISAFRQPQPSGLSTNLSPSIQPISQQLLTTSTPQMLQNSFVMNQKIFQNQGRPQMSQQPQQQQPRVVYGGFLC